MVQNIPVLYLFVPNNGRRGHSHYIHSLFLSKASLCIGILAEYMKTLFAYAWTLSLFKHDHNMLTSIFSFWRNETVE